MDMVYKAVGTSRWEIIMALDDHHRIIRLTDDIRLRVEPKPGGFQKRDTIEVRSSPHRRIQPICTARTLHRILMLSVDSLCLEELTRIGGSPNLALTPFQGT